MNSNILLNSFNKGHIYYIHKYLVPHKPHHFQKSEIYVSISKLYCLAKQDVSKLMSCLLPIESLYNIALILWSLQCL